MTNPNEPAFPLDQETTDRIDAGISMYTGVTKLEYFAGLAMQGVLSNPAFNENGSTKMITEMSVMCAKSLIEQLNKGGNES